MKILFPTDYSPNACNAFQFACNLAEKLGSSITLFHSYPIPLVNNDQSMSSFTHSIKEIYLSQIAKLEDFVVDFDIHATSLPIDKVRLEYKVETGETIKNIKKVAQEGEFDLIIMGTKGATDSQAALLGTVTSNLIDQIDIPVMAIPAGSRYKDFEKIALAEDFEQADESAVELGTKLCHLFKAELSIVHIAEVQDNANQLRTYNYYQLKRSEVRTLPEVSFDIIHGHDKVLALDEFVEKSDIDLLVMVARGQKDREGRSGLIRKMVEHSETPILSFPKN